MGRIRSTHPNQWTDSSFVKCSPLARLLALAIRNEADDNGIFKWDLIELKIRLLPADDCDISELLEELIQTNQVNPYEVDGKTYGIIRNFHRYQRPKKPTFYHTVPNQLPQGYTLHESSEGGGTEVLRDQDDTSSGIAIHSIEEKSIEEKSIEGESICTSGGLTFDAAISCYPKRNGSDPSKRAKGAWNARINEGAAPEIMIEGVKRYAAWCEETDKIDTEFVMQAAKFFGPDKHFEKQWSFPRKSPSKMQRAIAAVKAHNQ